MDIVKWIAWADVHHDSLGARCVTIDDTTLIEEAIFKRAAEIQANFTIFPGDRYLKREPIDEVKVKADKILHDYVHKGSIPHFHLVGNHDWVDNTMKWHTGEAMKMFHNCVVMDRSSTHLLGDNVAIHALPADFEMDIKNYEIDPGRLNIFVFHDAVRGCFLNEAKTQTYDSGLDLASIDLACFDLVMAGDIHVRQQLPFKNTWGGYLGSVCQRTKADANTERGWTEFTATRTSPTAKWTFESKFVPVRNFFTRVSFLVNEGTKPTDLIIPEKDMIDQLVEVKLGGDKKDVDRIADDPYWKAFGIKSHVRHLDILRAYETQQSDKVVDLTASDSIIGDVELYIDGNFSNLGGLTASQIIDKVAELRGGR